jgi:hypothetical protein
MPTYRAFLINADNRVASARAIDAETDAQAMESACALADGCDVEVWYLDRKVGRIARMKNQQARNPLGTKRPDLPREDA